MSKKIDATPQSSTCPWLFEGLSSSTSKVKNFTEKHPHLLPMAVAVIATAITDQYVQKNFQFTDISAPLLIKAIQELSEHWQIGEDGDDEEATTKGDKPKLIIQAMATSLIGAYTLFASHMKWDAVAISSAAFTALMLKNSLRKLEDLENLSNKMRSVIETVITVALPIIGFGVDQLELSSLKLGQIGLGISMSTWERKWRKFLDPIKPAEKGAKKTPRSFVILAGASLSTLGGAIGSKILSANSILTNSFIDSFLTAIKQTRKNIRLGKKKEVESEETPFVPPSTAKQVGFVAATTALAYGATFGNVPIITSALTKTASRGFEYVTNTAPNALKTKGSWLAMTVGLGAVFKTAEGAPSFIRQAGEVGLSMASNVSGLLVKGWQLGKGFFSKTTSPVNPTPSPL